MQGYDNASYGDAFADVYDDWYQGISDVPTTVATLAALANGGRVLELGVGTGRLAIPLAATGLNVVGVDSSAAMLERLAAKPGGDAVQPISGDMVDDLPPGPFHLIFVAYNTFFNLPDEHRQRSCLAQVAQLLGDDGCFVVEAFVPDLALHAQAQVAVRSITSDRVVLSVSSAEGGNQQIHGQFIDISEADGVRLRPWSIRWVTVDQLDHMANDAGLVLIDRWSAFDQTPFESDSTRHVSVFRRR